MKFFAPGIPEERITSPIPTTNNNLWSYSIQEHVADRAGKHYDFRLGDEKAGVAYSWAIRHWPEIGEKRLAVRQPDHTLKYMNWSGNIQEGYGRGNVKLKEAGEAEIREASKNKINFILNDNKYSLIKTKNDKWLILNRK